MEILFKSIYKYVKRISNDVPRDTIPVMVAATRVSSWLLRIVTIPPVTAIANAIRQAAWNITLASLLTRRKNAIKNTIPTIEPMVCLSRCLLNMADRPPRTAIIKDTIAIKSRICISPNVFWSFNALSKKEIFVIKLRFSFACQVLSLILSDFNHDYKYKWQAWKQEPILPLMVNSTVLVVKRHTQHIGVLNKKAGYKGPASHKRNFHGWFLGDQLRLIPFKRGYCQL